MCVKHPAAGYPLLRLGDNKWEPGAAALVFSFAGALVGTVSAWMGGELVERLGVGVHEGASLDAPSSLSSAASTRR
jgi:hypothetical protein